MKKKYWGNGYYFAVSVWWIILSWFGWRSPYRLILYRRLSVLSFVTCLQENKGRDFGAVNFEIQGYTLYLFPDSYQFSQDGFVNEVPKELAFTNETKPPRIAHLLSCIRTSYRGVGFDGLVISIKGTSLTITRS